MFEIFGVVVFKDSQRRSQNVGSTSSALVIRRFSLVDRANFFDISVVSVKMTAEHLQVAAVGPLRLSLVVSFSDLLSKTQAVLLIPGDEIVRDADPSVVQSQRLFAAVWMTA